MVQYKKLFQGAQSASLRDRVVSWGPAKNIPGDGIRDVGVLQVPNIPGQLSVPSFLLVVEVRLVSSPSCFECVSRQPGIGLDKSSLDSQQYSSVQRRHSGQFSDNLPSVFSG